MIIARIFAMIFVMINTLFWGIKLIKDVKEYINIRKGCGHLIFIIVDILGLLVSLFY